jgi:transcriptional regulator with PAS, ATPase and Fis domain
MEKNKEKVLSCLICIEDEREASETGKIVENLIKIKKEFTETLKCVKSHEITDDIYDHDFIIISENLLEKLVPGKIVSKVIIVLFRGNLKGKTVDLAMRIGAYALFPVDRFYGEKLEYTEIGRFEETLKKVFREKLSELKLECEIYKDINWKIDLKEDSEISTKFISLFSDEVMRKVLKNINIICQKVKPFFNKLEKFRDDIKKPMKEIEKAETSPEEIDMEKLKDNFKNIKDKIEKIGIQKIESILITGPTGAGKTLVAEYIYTKLSNDYLRENFSKISMANISSSLVDSELFGNFPGAFTDARFKIGKIVAAAGKVVFLDEIGEIDDKVQSKLLTYMDDMSVIVEGLSDTSLIKVPVLIIAATNKDLRQLAMTGNYRLDLFNRFKYRITIPPLKERINDLPYMISFLIQANLSENSTVKKISVAAIEKLKKYDYPGNFRELESIIAYAVTNAELDGRNCILEKDIQI